MNKFYKPKFGIKIDKLSKGDWQLGIFLNNALWHHYHNKVLHELYIYICLFKVNISIGFIEK